MKMLREIALTVLLFISLSSVFSCALSADTIDESDADEWIDPFCKDLIRAYFLDDYPTGENSKYYSEGTRKLDDDNAIMEAMEAYRVRYAKEHPKTPSLPIDQFRIALGKTLLAMAKRREESPAYIQSVASARSPSEGR